MAPPNVQLTRTISVPAAAIHGAQETPSGLIVLANGVSTIVDPALEATVRSELGFPAVRPFLADDPDMPMARYNNPDIGKPPPEMPAGKGAPMHVPGTPMTDAVKKVLGIA